MIDIAEKDTSPINPPIGFGDSVTSCSLAAGICAALYEQQKTGKGQKVMVSLLAQGIWNMGSIFASCQYGDEYPKTRKDAVSPVMNSFRCKDGEWLYISILEHDRYYNTLMGQVLGREDLVDDPRFAKAAEGKKHGRELIRILEEEFAKHTSEEMKEKLKAADIAHEVLQHITDVVNDLQAEANKYIVEIQNRDGSFTKYAQTPVKFNDIEPVVICDAPKVGQDSYEILDELGYSREEIDRMVEKGIVVCKK
jgi:crotonobetainyl-CoA:carnitine CoA-transferase CaiB-like acyl-CoA transferase